MSLVLGETVEQRLASGDVRVPMLPVIVTQVMAVVSDPRGDAQKLASLVGKDPALAAHVLKMANSAGLSRGRPAADLKEALTRLGMRMVSVLVMTASVKREVFNIPAERDRIDEMWRRSLGRAAWAKELSRKARQAPDQAFLCGLLQGIGRPVALKAVADTATVLGEHPDSPSMGRLLDQFERPLGQKVGTSWKLPGEVCACIDTGPRGVAVGEHAAMVRVVAVADRLVDAMNDNAPLPKAMHDIYARWVGLRPDELEMLRLSRQGDVRSAIASICG